MHTARSRLTWATVAHEFFDLTRADVMALAAPMGHAAGGFIWFQPGVCAAATQVILPGRDGARWALRVDEEGRLSTERV